MCPGIAFDVVEAPPHLRVVLLIPSVCHHPLMLGVCDSSGAAPVAVAEDLARGFVNEFLIEFQAFELSQLRLVDRADPQMPTRRPALRFGFVTLGFQARDIQCHISAIPTLMKT
jgi:hypothetical protein